MLEITKDELSIWDKEQVAYRLIDVREDWEHEHYNIGGMLIPLSGLMASAALIPRDIPVVFYCEKGIRSVIAIQRLEGCGFSNLYNLTGGMKSWKAV